MEPTTELEWIKTIAGDVSALRGEFADMRDDVAKANSVEPRVTALEQVNEERDRRALQIALAFIVTLFPLLVASGVAVAHI